VHRTLVCLDLAPLILRLRAGSENGKAQRHGTGCSRGHANRPERAAQAKTFEKGSTHSGVLFNLSALAMTETLLMAIAALAMIGLSKRPKKGYRIPAAIGTPSPL
jgi:hypothetical protein